MDAASADPDLDGDEWVLGILAEQYFQAVGEGVNLGV
jgi:hypothetical protein